MRTHLVLVACVLMVLVGRSPAAPVLANANFRREVFPAAVDQPAPIFTYIRDARAFLEVCPNEDPIYPQLKQDFQVLVEGQEFTPDLDCTGPVSALPVDHLTNQLMAWQVFRTIYDMSFGTEGRLPWTEKSLYDWMASSIGGINFKTAPGRQYCCDSINGKLYISSSLNTYPQYENFFDWSGIEMAVSFYAHETRHSNPGAPGHVTGCPAYPDPAGPAGCDAAYDLNNLGAYGVQSWLESQWATGVLNVGIGCSPTPVAQAIVEQHARNANSYRDRFVSDPPPQVTAVPPYGGYCIIANGLLFPLIWR